jgi:hypothetical protein
MRKPKKGFKRREHYYDPGKQPMPRKIIDASHVAKLPEKPTRQMLRAQQRRGG